MRWFWLTLAIIIAVGSSLGLYKFSAYINANLNVVARRTYEGRIYFQDKTQYQKFKEVLADSPDIHIYKLNELLSSDDPLVDFEITTTQESFPFGTLTNTIYKENRTTFVLVGMLSFFALILFSFCLIMTFDRDF